MINYELNEDTQGYPSGPSLDLVRKHWEYGGTVSEVYCKQAFDMTKPTFPPYLTFYSIVGTLEGTTYKYCLFRYFMIGQIWTCSMDVERKDHAKCLKKLKKLL